MSRLLRKFAFCSKTDTETRPSSEVECAVCQDPPTKPCTVPCGNNHVFCQACLQGLITHNHYSSHFPCPLCRTRVRIPLGGVAVFRQGKGARSRFLARLPALRPRCRRRRSSMDSVSSGWPDDLSLSDFGRGMDRELGEPEYNSDSDDDDDEMDDGSVFGISSRPRTGLTAEQRDLDSWLNSLDPEQVMILEEINRQREQAARLGAERSDPVSRALEALDEAVLFQGSARGVLEESVNEADEAEEGGEGSSLRPGGDDEDSLAIMEEVEDIATRSLPDILSGSEDLDLTVVLQMIADMENDDREDTGRTASLGVEDEDCSRTVYDPSFSERAEDTTDSRGDDSPRPHSSQQQSPLSAHKDWKLRTIAGTAIPRPKLTFAIGASGKERLEFNDDEEHLECLGPGCSQLQQQVFTDGSVSEEEMELPRQDKHPRDILSQEDVAVDMEGKRMGRKDMQITTEHNTSSEPHSSDTDSPTEWNSRLNPTDIHTRLSAEGEPPPHSEHTGRDPPEDPHALFPADDDLLADTQVGVTEGPSEWVRRIRSLQHRRRGPSTKRSITRSHSHGGKTESREREGDKETDPQGVDGRGDKETGRGREGGQKWTSERETSQNLAADVEQEAMTKPPSGNVRARNVTVINL